MCHWESFGHIAYNLREISLPHKEILPTAQYFHGGGGGHLHFLLAKLMGTVELKEDAGWWVVDALLTQ